MPDAVNRNGAFVEALVAKLRPMLDPPDIEGLVSMARRASQRDALRAALDAVLTAATGAPCTPADWRVVEDAEKLLEDTIDA